MASKRAFCFGQYSDEESVCDPEICSDFADCKKFPKKEVSNMSEKVDLSIMDMEELLAFAEESDINIEVDDDATEDDVRAALAAFLYGEEPEEVAEEEGRTETTETDPEEEEIDLDSMNRSELKTFIKERELDIKVTKGLSDDDIRLAVLEALTKEAEPEAEPEEEPEEERLEVEPETEPEEPEEPVADQFDGMDRTELKIYIKENELPVKVTKNMSDDNIREAIRQAEAEAVEPEEPEEGAEAGGGSDKKKLFGKRKAPAVDRLDDGIVPRSLKSFKDQMEKLYTLREKVSIINILVDGSQFMGIARRGATSDRLLCIVYRSGEWKIGDLEKKVGRWDDKRHDNEIKLTVTPNTVDESIGIVKKLVAHAKTLSAGKEKPKPATKGSKGIEAKAPAAGAKKPTATIPTGKKVVKGVGVVKK